MQHHFPEGHCELLFRDVRVPAARLQTRIVDRATAAYFTLPESPSWLE